MSLYMYMVYRCLSNTCYRNVFVRAHQMSLSEYINAYFVCVLLMLILYTFPVYAYLICFLLMLIFMLPVDAYFEWRVCGAGMLMHECTQLWHDGPKQYVTDWWNWMDSSLIFLYLCYYSLQFVVYFKVSSRH